MRRAAIKKFVLRELLEQSGIEFPNLASIIDLDVDVIRGRNAPELLQRVRKKLEQRREPHEEVGRFVVKQIVTRMSKQVAPGGRPWPPLSEVTRERRARRLEARGKILGLKGTRRSVLPGITKTGKLRPSGFGPRVPTRDFPALFETGELRRSIKWELGRGVQFGGTGKTPRRSVTATRIQPHLFGEDRTKAAVQQGFGLDAPPIATGPRKKDMIPSRPYIGLSRDDEQQILRIFNKWANIIADKIVTQVK